MHTYYNSATFLRRTYVERILTSALFTWPLNSRVDARVVENVDERAGTCRKGWKTRFLYHAMLETGATKKVGDLRFLFSANCLIMSNIVPSFIETT